MTPKFVELQCVTLRTDHSSVRAGTVGTVVHIFTQPGIAYLVEFCDEQGVTTEMVTISDESDIVAWVPESNVDLLNKHDPDR